jgi:hypothetical protein
LDRLIPLEARADWEAALAGVPHGFAHTWESCNALAESSRYSTYLYTFEDTGIRIVCPIAERPAQGFVDLVTPYGFSGFVGTGDYPGFADHWSRFAHSKGYVCAYLALNPVLTNRTYFAGIAKRHRTVYVLDLSLGEAELFARLSKKRRWQLRKAARNPSAFVRDRERLTRFFVRVYPDFMERRGAADVYRVSSKSLAALCESPQVVMVGAEQDQKVVAVSLFGWTKDCGDFLYNVSLPDAERYSAALIWEGVQDLIARDVPVLNLGGGVVEGDSLAQFKERFRGEPRSLENVQQIYRQDVYDELCRAAGVRAEDRTAYFPAYRSSRAKVT